MICEKPSLMREVQKCYNNHISEIKNKVGEIDFIALKGHICTNYEPNDYDEWGSLKWDEVEYPMVPAGWGVKLIDNDFNKKIISKIKSQKNNYDGFIVGTDSDAEGYGIYHLLEIYLNITDRKALRFMEHSLTDEEILESLLTMTDFHTDPKHIQFTESFLLRSRADWLFGMNATRMMSTRMQNVFAIGRVKTPTIKLVYDNSMEIDNFKPKNYYNLEADYGDFSAVLTEDSKNPKKFDELSEIPQDIPNEGKVVYKEVKRVTTHAPKLYDLPAIQVEAGQTFKYKPDEVLSIIQSLYETHKVISYPRTQCRYVSSEKAKEFGAMLNQMYVFDDLKNIASSITADMVEKVYADKQVVNDAEVQKESHDALLPTSTIPDLSKMNEKEINICHMIYKRLLAQFLPMLEEDKTQILIKHNEYGFIAKGKIVINQGWRLLYGNAKENIIPNVNEGDIINAKEFKALKKTTTPPKRLSQATLIYAMEHIDTVIKDKELKKSLADSKGIGTPATRDTIIKDIIRRNYIEDKKGGLYITEEGKRYIKSVEALDISSPVFAAKMDTEIKKIQRGESDFNQVYDETVDNLYTMCNQIALIETHAVTVDSKCIKCGSNLKINRYSYECPDCDVKIPKEICSVKINEDILNTIMNKEKTSILTFKKKDGIKFNGRLYWNSDEGKLSFDFNSGINCPLCNNEVKINKGGAFCDCGLKLFRNFIGHSFNDKELIRLLNNEALNKVKLKKKDGTVFDANLKLNNEGSVDLFWD